MDPGLTHERSAAAQSLPQAASRKLVQEEADAELPGLRQSRFGAAERLLDLLDTRPLEQRRRRRPWWRFW